LPTNEYRYILLFGVVNGFAKIFGYTFMSDKQGPGRPALPDDEKRKPAFLLKLTDAEFAEIRRAAGGKVSTWARNVLLRAAKRVK
jgi:hypothetical protein